MPVKGIEQKVHDEGKKGSTSETVRKSIYNSTTDTPSRIEATVTGSVKADIKKALRSYKFKEGKKFTYGFKPKRKSKTKTIANANNYRYHIYSDVKRGQIIDTLRLLVIQEVDNKVMEIKEYVRR
jgi:hypothetical protein